MRILFVCTANRDRSLTAHHYFKDLYPQHEFDSCGIDKYHTELSPNRNPVSKHITGKLCEWAERIVCMEPQHYDYIVRQIDKKHKAKMEVIHLDDFEAYMQPSLIDNLVRLIKLD